MLGLKKRLFNPGAVDDPGRREIFGGETTCLMNLNNIKYQWANNLYKQMRENIWHAEAVDLSQDKTDYNLLTPEERRTYNGVLSFLIFLDSIQTNNLPEFLAISTAPEVNLVLAEQISQESLHSHSYQYLIESVVPVSEREAIYDFWRNDPILKERNAFIAEIFERFRFEPNHENTFRALVADLVLEGVYFYNGFNVFYLLNSRSRGSGSGGILEGTKDMIRYIHRDEATHFALFQNIILNSRHVFETAGVDTDAILLETFLTGTEQEIAWARHITGGKILGMSDESIEQYTKNLSNRRLRPFKLEPFPGHDYNPYEYLERLSGVDAGAVRSNYFEGTVIDYNPVVSQEGWDF